MILDRKTASAALALVVIVLSQWPVVDSPPFQLAIFLCGGVLVAVLGVSERARASRLVVGAVGMLFVLQGAYEIIRGRSWIGFAVGVLYGGLGALVVIYQSGFAPWGTPRGAIDNR
jgi:peptidoglycan/LPS O-acetylase OafA/YrhL